MPRDLHVAISGAEIISIQLYMFSFKSNLKFKLSALFFLFSAGLSIALATGSYFKTETTLLTNLQDRLRNIAYLTAIGLDPDPIQKLRLQLKPNLKYYDYMRVHATPEYVYIAGRLSEIQQKENKLIIYTYIVVNDEKSKKTFVLAESSASSDIKAIEEMVQEHRLAGHQKITIDQQIVAIQNRSNASIVAEITHIEEVWHFGHIFDISQYPVMQQAYREKLNQTESELSYDPEGESLTSEEPGQWLISGYAPVFDTRGQMLGLVGIDISADQLKATLAETFWFHIWAGGIAVAIALVSSLLLGWFLTGSIRRLESSVHALSERRLNVRAPVESQDEIGRLARAFNSMADTIQAYNEHLESMVAKRTDALRQANLTLKDRNAQLGHDLEMARRVQENLLPDQARFQEMPAVQLASHYRPMEGVGGDLYDIFLIDEKHYGFLIADVSGHGVASALITAMAKVAFQTHAMKSISPAEVCQMVNYDLFRLIGDLIHYLTAAYCVLNRETGELRFSLAGHQPLLLYHNNSGQVEELWSQSLFMGIEAEIDSQEKTTQMLKGDRLFLYTDGILETRNLAGELYDMDRLKQSIVRFAKLSPVDSVDAIIKDVELFNKNASIEDDRALVCVEYIGSGQVSTGIEETHAKHSIL